MAVDVDKIGVLKGCIPSWGLWRKSINNTINMKHSHVISSSILKAFLLNLAWSNKCFNVVV